MATKNIDYRLKVSINVLRQQRFDVQTERMDLLVVCLFKIRKPTAPATKELSKMLIFEPCTISALSKAKNVVKNDIVNPIPP